MTITSNTARMADQMAFSIEYYCILYVTQGFIALD